MGGVKQSQSASWGNRHVADGGKGGRPENAVGYLSEGDMAAVKGGQFAETFAEQALQLGSSGLTEEEWAQIQERLRTAWGRFSKKNYCAEIKKIDEEILKPKGLTGVYAEYGV